jgi:hypothetical protein
MCGHPRRVHAQDGACNICWCFQFESSAVENPGTPHRIREVVKLPAPTWADESPPIEEYEPVSPSSMPRGDL